jgi:predicted DNA-binding transcriptional regulator AlpA
MEKSVDELVPDPVVQKEFGVCAMTLYRWDHDPAMEFPKPVKIRNRKYRSRRKLEKYKARLLRKAIAVRAGATGAA